MKALWWVLGLLATVGAILAIAFNRPGLKSSSVALVEAIHAPKYKQLKTQIEQVKSSVQASEEDTKVLEKELKVVQDKIDTIHTRARLTPEERKKRYEAL